MIFQIFTDRIAREKQTFAHMLGIFCRAHHGTDRLCRDCDELQRHVDTRLTRCPFGLAKPTCGSCCRNCHPPDRREHIRAIMRFAGPRMLWRHPLLALLHLLDSRQRAHNEREKQS